MPSPSHVPGDCFAKCKHGPWYLTSEWDQKSKYYREHWSCTTARALGCKTDGGKKTGYIDFCKGPGCKTNKWRTCTCARKYRVSPNAQLCQWKVQ